MKLILPSIILFCTYFGNSHQLLDKEVSAFSRAITILLDYLTNHPLTHGDVKLPEWMNSIILYRQANEKKFPALINWGPLSDRQEAFLKIAHEGDPANEALEMAAVILMNWDKFDGLFTKQGVLKLFIEFVQSSHFKDELMKGFLIYYLRSCSHAQQNNLYHKMYEMTLSGINMDRSSFETSIAEPLIKGILNDKLWETNYIRQFYERLNGSPPDLSIDVGKVADWQQFKEAYRKLSAHVDLGPVKTYYKNNKGKFPPIGEWRGLNHDQKLLVEKALAEDGASPKAATVILSQWKSFMPLLAKFDFVKKYNIRDKLAYALRQGQLSKLGKSKMSRMFVSYYIDPLYSERTKNLNEAAFQLFLDGKEFEAGYLEGLITEILKSGDHGGRIDVLNSLYSGLTWVRSSAFSFDTYDTSSIEKWEDAERAVNKEMENIYSKFTNVQIKDPEYGGMLISLYSDGKGDEASTLADWLDEYNGDFRTVSETFLSFIIRNHPDALRTLEGAILLEEANTPALSTAISLWYKGENPKPKLSEIKDWINVFRKIFEKYGPMSSSYTSRLQDYFNRECKAAVVGLSFEEVLAEIKKCDELPVSSGEVDKLNTLLRSALMERNLNHKLLGRGFEDLNNQELGKLQVKCVGKKEMEPWILLLGLLWDEVKGYFPRRDIAMDVSTILPVYFQKLSNLKYGVDESFLYYISGETFLEFYLGNKGLFEGESHGDIARELMNWLLRSSDNNKKTQAVEAIAKEYNRKDGKFSRVVALINKGELSGFEAVKSYMQKKLAEYYQKSNFDIDLGKLDKGLSVVLTSSTEMLPWNLILFSHQPPMTPYHEWPLFLELISKGCGDAMSLVFEKAHKGFEDEKIKDWLESKEMANFTPYRCRKPEEWCKYLDFCMDYCLFPHGTSDKLKKMAKYFRYNGIQMGSLQRYGHDFQSLLAALRFSEKCDTQLLPLPSEEEKKAYTGYISKLYNKANPESLKKALPLGKFLALTKEQQEELLNDTGPEYNWPHWLVLALVDHLDPNWEDKTVFMNIRDGIIRLLDRLDYGGDRLKEAFIKYFDKLGKSTNLDETRQYDAIGSWLDTFDYGPKGFEVVPGGSGAGAHIPPFVESFLNNDG